MNYYFHILLLSTKNQIAFVIVLSPVVKFIKIDIFLFTYRYFKMNHINKENANPSPASGKQAKTHFQHDPSLFKDQIDTFEHQILVENIEQRLCAWYSYLNYLKQFSHEELKDNQIRLQTLYSRCLDKCKGILKIRPNDEKFTKIFIEYVSF